MTTKSDGNVVCVPVLTYCFNLFVA
ncbi:uncharacterized protein METZ01_LOCUS94546 [marine metagenome]|uniref:Uncharacterized protein n=1 Tax=marine metagenome TaxID=408172 RepID=A0A381VN38_9ZZZZ